MPTNLRVVKMGGVEITKEDQVPKEQQKAFDNALRQQINGLKAANGKSVKDCLFGLAKGEKADKNFDKLKQLYFKKNGVLVAGWFSPEFNEDWQEGSICAKDMTTTTDPCKFVQTASSGGAGK